MDPPEQPPPATEDSFDALRERVREAADAAGRLAGDDRPPPRGWEVPAPSAQRGPSSELAELVALVERTGSVLVDVSRGLVPADLRGQFADALRELLIALRALIDWYLERLDQPRPEPVEVEDIPIL